MRRYESLCGWRFRSLLVCMQHDAGLELYYSREERELRNSVLFMKTRNLSRSGRLPGLCFFPLRTVPARPLIMSNQKVDLREVQICSSVPERKFQQDLAASWRGHRDCRYLEAQTLVAYVTFTLKNFDGPGNGLRWHFNHKYGGGLQYVWSCTPPVSHSTPIRAPFEAESSWRLEGSLIRCTSPAEQRCLKHKPIKQTTAEERRHA